MPDMAMSLVPILISESRKSSYFPKKRTASIGRKRVRGRRFFSISEVVLRFAREITPRGPLHALV